MNITLPPAKFLETNIHEIAPEAVYYKARQE
jgi:hypothetical protein